MGMMMQKKRNKETRKKQERGEKKIATERKGVNE
jgi:hypothetical protein